MRWFHLPETAMILPGKFGAINNEIAEADSYDVRQNLKTWHREERNTDEYCVVFRVEKAMKSCKLNEDTKSLVRGGQGEHKKYCHCLKIFAGRCGHLRVVREQVDAAAPR